MADPESPDPGPFSSFARFVAETRKKYVGRDLADNPKPYVPLSALQEFWEPARISSVLRAFPHRLDISVGLITRSYLRIFSTLVYTDPDAVRNLEDLFISHNFTDEKLPWGSRPREWPNTPFFNKLFKKIARNQWQFFPLHFHPDRLHNRLIRDQHVLPIRFTEEIAQGTAASVRAFAIQPEYNDLAPKDKHGRPIRDTFVFKIYHNQKHESSYNNERVALLRLGSSPSPNVVKFYGSLQQHGSFSLILEHADGGDLGQFFANAPPPPTVDDVALFWRSLFQVFAGLERIHQLMSFDEKLIIKGIHEDIRPENILLMKGPSGSPYDFTPKIADFGLYSRVRTAKVGSGMGLDHYGNQRFSSPECCHHTISRHSGTNMITTVADIFSIGAVLSHTVAWVVGGCEEQELYFKARKAHHDTNLRRFKNSGYEGCFHDSIEPLPVVAAQHKLFRKRLDPSDHVTPRVLEWVEQHMLQGVRDRRKAKDILEMYEQFVDSRSKGSPLPTPAAVTEATLQLSCLSVQAASPPSATNGASESPLVAAPSGVDSELVARPAEEVVLSSRGQDAITPASDLSPPLQPNDSSSTIQPSVDEAVVPSPLHPHVGITQIHEFFKSDPHQGRLADPDTAELVDVLEYNCGGRDQFFFIDDSASMRADSATIAAGFRALACIAKRLDPNRVELAFASRPRKVHRARRTTRLLRLVARCEYKGDGHLMENRLGELIDGAIIPRLPYKILGRNVNLWARKQVSLYVFTDGDWGDAANCGDACGVERPIQRLIEELKKRRLDRTQVSLHFVMFGDKANGRKHLERLDEFGREDGWDIVDVKHIRTGVGGMIIGPLTRSNDDIPTS